MVRAEIARFRRKTVATGEQGSAAARARIRALQAEINALHGKTATITIITVRKGGAVMTGGGRTATTRE